MAVFKKLIPYGTASTSGTRKFTRLRPVRVVFDGTNLENTRWRIKSGWSAEAGYGEFDIGGFLKRGAGYISFSEFCIGYGTETPLSKDGRFATPNSVIWSTLAETVLSDTAEERTFSFVGGTDLTNARLINWVVENCELVATGVIL